MALSNLGRADRGTWFTASYKSDCAGNSSKCLITIKEDDQARYIDGEVVCEECGSDDDERTVVDPDSPMICPSCHLELSATEQRAGLTRHEEC